MVTLACTPAASYEASGPLRCIGIGWWVKKSQMIGDAEIENVVNPTAAAIDRENALPGHAWPPPVMR